MKYVLLVGLGVIVALAAVFFRAHDTSEQTISCVASQTCRTNWNNTGICELLPIGTAENELVFRLGQPIGRSDHLLYFEPGATEKGPIQVELNAANQAARFFCHGRA